MAKMIFADLTLCTACRGCQVACKQWKKLPAEKTRNWGSYQNPPDLSHDTIRLVRFTEAVVNDKLEWLFFPEQCRHCYSAPCKRFADRFDPNAIKHDEETGAVVFTDRIAKIPAQGLRDSCPYDIPRSNEAGVSSKCDFCLDRIQGGMVPSCVLTCPTQCLVFGEEDEIQALAAKRLKEVRKQYPEAYLGDPLNVRVLYLFQTDHRLYYQR